METYELIDKEKLDLFFSNLGGRFATRYGIVKVDLTQNGKISVDGEEEALKLEFVKWLEREGAVKKV